MAKARKVRAAKKRSPVTTAKLKRRKVVKPKATRARKRGVIAGAVQAVKEAVSLRTRLSGHNQFEDE